MGIDPVLERVEKLEKAFETLAVLPQAVAGLKAGVGRLEGRVGQLEGRVGNLEVQIVQLRTEMRDAFSAMRGEFLELFDAASRATHAMFKETWAQARALHEDVIERIKQLGEARS